MEVRTDDDVLVAAVRRGDDRAFEQLYGRYQRRIAAYVYGMVNDYGRAEDLTQEIFVSALRRMRATERPIAFKPWIYEIARNACIDQFRRSRRTEEVSFDAEEAAGALELAHLAGGTSPDAAIHAKQQLDDLCGAFGGLSDSHHEILVMRELEGLSYREIGERLGLSRPSVESTLFRARKRLTEEYDELVSGERCRRVTELLAQGRRALGAREEKRLARHVAHCQPCRRQAYAAGVDTTTLTNVPRRSIARVAAFLPLPAFLRLRGASDTTHWSNTLATLAEPAAGWTKAVAAALLIAGGAGVAGHSDRPAPVEPSAPVVAAPAAVERPADLRGESARPSLRPAAFPAAAAASTSPSALLNKVRVRAPRTSVAEPIVPAAPPRTPSADPLAVTPAPSAKELPPSGGEPVTVLPSVRAVGDPPSPDSSDPAVPVINPPTTVGQTVEQSSSAVTKADGNAGQAYNSATAALGFGE
ncbi:MAG: sigma-70 family RNA polymerase sigma factor [Solirubrobacteraceae bacterium]